MSQKRLHHEWTGGLIDGRPVSMVYATPSYWIVTNRSLNQYQLVFGSNFVGKWKRFAGGKNNLPVSGIKQISSAGRPDSLLLVLSLLRRCMLRRGYVRLPRRCQMVGYEICYGGYIVSFDFKQWNDRCRLFAISWYFHHFFRNAHAAVESEPLSNKRSPTAFATAYWSHF